MIRLADLGCLCILLLCASLVKLDVISSAINSPNQSRRARSGSDIPVVDELNYPEATNEDSTRIQFVPENESQWNIRSNIPGLPNIDYPIYSKPPSSNFVCQNRHDGYYADVESRCQVFRVCANTDLTGKGFAFLCPNGTLFNQKYFVCDWYKNVDCLQSELYYSRNNEIGQNMGSLSDLMEVVQRMLDFTQPTNDLNKPVQSPFNLGQFNKATTSNLGQKLENPQLGVPKTQDSIPNFEVNNIANGRPHSRNPLPETSSTGSNVTPDNRVVQNPSHSINPQNQNAVNDQNIQSRRPMNSGFPNRGSQRNRTNNKHNNRHRPNTAGSPIQDQLFDLKSMEPGTANKLHLLVNSLGETMEAPEHIVNSIRQSNEQTTQIPKHRNRYTGQNNQHIPNNEQISSTFSTNQSVEVNASAGQSNLIRPNLTTNIRNGLKSTAPLTAQTAYTGQGNLLGQNIGNEVRPNLQRNQLNQNGQTINSGEGSLLTQHNGSQKLKQQQGQAQFISSGQGNVISQTHMQQNQYSDNGSQLGQSNGQKGHTIYSGEGNLLGQSVGQNGPMVHSGVGNQFLQSSGQQISKHQTVYTGERNLLKQSVGQPHIQNGHTVHSGEGNLLSQSIGQNRPAGQIVNSGEGNLLSQSIGNRGPTGQTVYSGEGNLLSQSFGQQQGKQHVKEGQTVYSGEGNLLNQSIGQNRPVGQIVNSGEGNLLSQSFGNRRPNGQTVYSGEGNLQSQSIGQKDRPDQTVSSHNGNQLGQSNGQPVQTGQTVYSGEGSLLSQSIGQRKPAGQTVYSGEGNLLTQSIGYRGPTGQTVYSGEGNLLTQTIGQQHVKEGQTVYSGQGNLLGQSIRQQGQTVYSGEGNLLSQSIGQVVKPVQIVYSGEGNLLGQSIGQQQIRQQLPTGQTVYSGEGNLLTHSIGQNGHTGQSVNSVGKVTFGRQEGIAQAVYSGEGNLLSQSFGQHQIHKQIHTEHSVYSGQRNTPTFIGHHGQQVDQAINAGKKNLHSQPDQYADQNPIITTLHENTIGPLVKHGETLLASITDPSQGSSFPATQYLPISLMQTGKLSPAQFVNEELNIHYESDPTRQYHSNRDVKKAIQLLLEEPIEALASDKVLQQELKPIPANSTQENLSSQNAAHSLFTKAFESVSLDDILDLNHIPSTIEHLGPTNKTSATIESTIEQDLYNSSTAEFGGSPIIVLADDDEDVPSNTPVEKSENLLFQGLQLSLFEKEDNKLNSFGTTGTKHQQKISRRGDEPLSNSLNEQSKIPGIVTTNRTKPHPSNVLRNYVAAAIANNTRKDTNSSKTVLSKTKLINETTNLSNSTNLSHHKNNGSELNRKFTHQSNELDVNKQNQGFFKEIVRHTKDVHGRNKTRQQQLSNTASNSIKLIFERAKNRSSDYKIKLKQRDSRPTAASDSVQERSFSLLEKNLSQLNKSTKNKFRDDEIERTHKAGIVFKDLQSTGDFQRLFINDENNSDDELVAAETHKISNRVKFPNDDNPNRLKLTQKQKTTDILPASSALIGSSKTVITFQPSYELANVKTPSYWNTKSKFTNVQNHPMRPQNQRTQHVQNRGTERTSNIPRQYQPQINDQIFAESTIQDSAVPLIEDASFQQIAADEIVHFSTIENMATNPQSFFASGTNQYSKQNGYQGDQDQQSGSWHINDSNERYSYFNSMLK